jgi:hypothetical protein
VHADEDAVLGELQVAFDHVGVSRDRLVVGDEGVLRVVIRRAAVGNHDLVLERPCMIGWRGRDGACRGEAGGQEECGGSRGDNDSGGSAVHVLSF